MFHRRYGRGSWLGVFVDKPLIQVPFDEAMRIKWARGQAIYGPEFVGDPIHNLFEELVDASNYLEEARLQGLASENDAYGMQFLISRLVGCTLVLEARRG